jgi:quercetin dioxygenase-like cupin family protein
MGKIHFVIASDTVDDMVSVNPADETPGEAPRPEWQAHRSFYFPLTDERMQLYEIRLAPDTEIRPHAHHEDEIVYITDGEIHVGRRVLPVGSAIYVERDTLYGLRAGPEGCTFLNFRPGLTAGYISKADVVARRRADLAGRPAADVAQHS